MSVSTERVSQKYYNVATGVAISVDIPCKDAAHVYVYWGKASTLAVQGSDYAVDLADDYGSFTVTPTSALLAKINNAIAANPADVNTITVRRRVPITTDITPETVRFRERVSDEFDLTVMRLQQMSGDAGHVVRVPDDETGDAVLPVADDRSLRVAGYDGGGNPAVAATTLEQLDALTLAALNAGKVARVGVPFISDGTTATIDTGYALQSTAQLFLSVGGVYQPPAGGAYTVSGTTFTFTEVPPTGTKVCYLAGWVAEVGNGLQSAVINGSGHLVFTYTDGTTQDFGSVIASNAWSDITGKPATFPPSTHTHAQADVTGLAAALALLAPLLSPALTGTPTAPTAANGTNTAQIATTAFVQAAVAALLNSAPATLDTLNELAAALGNDPNFATTITNALAAKAPLASPALTGTPTAPTAATSTNTTQIATTAFAQALAASLLSGTAPAALAAAAAIGTATTYARADHAHQRQLESIVIALGDETTAITTGTAKVTIRMPYAFTLTDVRASLATAGSSATIVNVKEAGASIFSTKLQIDSGAKTSVGSAAPRVISDTSLADDAEITLDIDTAGAGAKGLKVTLIGRQSA